MPSKQPSFTCCLDWPLSGTRDSPSRTWPTSYLYTSYPDTDFPHSLSDVPSTVCLKLSRSEFRRSRWWTRGWTLQELLAPSKVVFLVDGDESPESSAPGRRLKETTKPASVRNHPTLPAPEGQTASKWRSIGEKTDLSDLIASITGVDIDILVDPALLGNASIAQRMSWAANRVTSRPEDMAYCLMGLFDVQMPMLYGEGAEKAFLRLQEEIMASSDDQSLFAWRDEDACPDARYGLLATTPKFFQNSSRKVPYDDWKCRPPYQMTNRGLQVELPLTKLPGPKDRYRAVLDCPVPPDYEDHCFLTIFLEKLPGSEVQFARVMADQFGQQWHPGETQQIYVRQHHHHQTATKPTGVFPRHVFQLHKATFPKGTYQVRDVLVPPGAEASDTLAAPRGATHWLPERHPRAFRIGKVPWAQVAGAILFEREEDGERLLVRMGSAGHAKVGFDAVRSLPGHRAGSEDEQHLRRQAHDAFVPLQSGQTLELKHHRVRVNFAEPQVYGGSKYILVDVEVEAVRFADQAPYHWKPAPVRDSITLVDSTTTGSTQGSAPAKLPRWKRWMSRDQTAKVDKMTTLRPPRPLAVRHAASAGTLRELARWSGEG